MLYSHYWSYKMVGLDVWYTGWGKMKKESCYGPYDNIILTGCTIYGMGKKIKGDSRLESIIQITLSLITNPAHLFEVIWLRNDGVMAIKPFTFDIWGKNIVLLIWSINRSYYTGWKGLIYTSPMQLRWGQSIDLWWSYPFTGFSDCEPYSQPQIFFSVKNLY